MGSVRVEYEFYILNKERGFEEDTSGGSVGDNSSSESEYVWVTIPSCECTVRLGEILPFRTKKDGECYINAFKSIHTQIKSERIQVSSNQHSLVGSHLVA